MKELKQSIDQLIEHWRKQDIIVSSKSPLVINTIEKQKSVLIPIDFKEFYSRVNGMESLYPNGSDEEGFLFYPVEEIIKIRDEFEDYKLNEDIYIFADYLHKSWWYGYKIIKDNEYEIGIVPEKEIFIPISKKLSDFIEIYLSDSHKLYEF